MHASPRPVQRVPQAVTVALVASALLFQPPTHAHAAGSGAPVLRDHSGAFAYEVPLAVPPGPGGLQPDLALVYSSSAGNGDAGIGFSLPYSALRLDLSWGVPSHWYPWDDPSQLCAPAAFSARVWLDSMELVPAKIQ
jgi:hypothetical protein